MMLLKRLLLSLTVVSVFTACAQTTFTALEQQQISIETPGLFDKSDAFTVDFGLLRPTDYSYPLPVSTQAEHKSDNNVEMITRKGDAVKAMFAGHVRLARSHPQFGNVIVIRHDNGLETVYGRNAQNLVKVGDRVKAGQTIAIVGGDGSRYYCEFAMMVNGRRINPSIILSLKSHRLLQQTVMFKREGFNISLTVVDPDPWLNNEKDLAEGTTPGEVDPFGGSNKFAIDFSVLDASEWCYPLPGAKVISNYGRRGGRGHTGVDLKTKPADDIFAAFDGVVKMAKPYSGYGNCIVIRHPNGLETLYSHNKKNLVKVGDRVKAGQKIALTGQTGRATTPHLHFECRVGGRPFDPFIIWDHSTHSLRFDVFTFHKNGSVSRGGKVVGSVSKKSSKSKSKYRRSKKRK